MFELAKQLELVICKYSGQELWDVIERNISDNKLIMRDWNILSRSITNKTLMHWIKKQMIIKWINIKAKSYVSSYIQVLKHRINSHTSDDGIKPATIVEPALLLTLHSGNWVSVSNNF